jgi:DNA polymerase (family 10)
MDNRMIARRLLDMAHLLERDRVNLYRVRAYRQAAQVIDGLDQPLEDLLATSGRKGLKELPGIGGRLSAKIEKLVQTGEFPILKEEGHSLVAT